MEAYDSNSNKKSKKTRNQMNHSSDNNHILDVQNSQNR